jgi:hypothetical protein
LTWGPEKAKAPSQLVRRVQIASAGRPRNAPLAVRVALSSAYPASEVATWTSRRIMPSRRRSHRTLNR